MECPAVVGAFAAAVFTVLWPDTPVDYWEKVKKQVYAAIEQALDKAKVQELKDLLEGTKNNCKEYVDTTNEEEKKSRAVAFDVVLTQLKNRFMDESLDLENVDRKCGPRSHAYGHKMLPKLTAFHLGKIDNSCRFDPMDQLVIKHNKLERTGTYEVTIMSSGVTQDHKTGQDLVYAAFMVSKTFPYGCPVHTEILGGKASCSQQLAEYRGRIKTKTDEY